MRKPISILSLLMLSLTYMHAQKIIDIQNADKKYQVLDLTTENKITWGGYTEIGAAAKSEQDGTMNTKAIVLGVGNNPDYDGKIYAAKVCDNSVSGGFDDWYLPAKEEAALIYLNIDKFGWTNSMTLWTSTEYAGTQAVSLYTYNGTWYNVSKLDEYNYVCIRKTE